MGKTWRCVTKKTVMIAMLAAALLVPNLPAMAKSVNPVFILMSLDPLGLKTEENAEESGTEAVAAEEETPVTEAPSAETSSAETEAPQSETPGAEVPETGTEESQTEPAGSESETQPETSGETAQETEEVQTDAEDPELTDFPDGEEGEDADEETETEEPETDAGEETQTAQTGSSGSGNDPVIAPVLDEAQILKTILGFSIDVSSYPPADTSANTKYIYKYLTEVMGLNHAAACGVLANMQLESGFNQYAVGDGGTSYGICQWHNERFSSLMLYCGSTGQDYNTLDGQLAYLFYELSGRYPNVLNYLRAVPDTPDGAYSAGYYWCVYYEVPSETQARAAQRGNLARYEYYPLDLSLEEPAEEISEESVYETSEESVSDESPVEVIRQLRDAMDAMEDENSEEDAGEIRMAVADVREMMEAEND